MNKEIKGILERIVGSDYLTDEMHDLIAYSRDIGPYPPNTGELIVRPKNTEQVSAVLKVANRYKVPVTTRAGGTSIVGTCIPSEGGIILDIGRMDKILEINEDLMTVTAQGGCGVFKVEKALHKRNLRIPLRTMFASTVTVGSWVSTNGFGLRNSKYGRTSEFTMGLEVVLPTGEIIRTGSNAYSHCGPFSRYTGLDMTQLFSGVCGAMGVITEVTLRAVAVTEGLDCLSWCYDDPMSTVRVVTELQRRDLVTTYDMEDADTFKMLNVDVPLPITLTVDVEGDKFEVEHRMKEVKKVFRKEGGVEIGYEMAKMFWDNIVTVSFFPAAQGRFHCVAVNNAIPAFPEVYRTCKAIYKKYNIDNGWLGVGIVPTYMISSPIGFYKEPEQWDDILAAEAEIFEALMNIKDVAPVYPAPMYKPNFEKMRPASYEFQKLIKRAVDPNNIMNPGILPH